MTAWAVEEQRVVEAYRRRSGRTYSWGSQSYLFEAQERERLVLLSLEQHGLMPLAGRAILDVGCGSGRWLRDLLRWGAEPSCLTGLELRPDAVAKARRLLGPHVTVECGSATNLPYPEASFDLAVMSMVLSSALEDAAREAIAAETVRVLKPGGSLIWYDFCFDNPANRDVRGVSRRELRALFAGCSLDLRRAVLPPFVLRRLVPVSWLAAYALGQVPWLCAFYVGLITKPARD